MNNKLSKQIYVASLRENTQQMKIYSQLLHELRENFYQQSLYLPLIMDTATKLESLKLERTLLNVGRNKP